MLHRRFRPAVFKRRATPFIVRISRAAMVSVISLFEEHLFLDDYLEVVSPLCIDKFLNLCAMSHDERFIYLYSINNIERPLMDRIIESNFR